MEITQIDRQVVVSEEDMETTAGDTGTGDLADDEELTDFVQDDENEETEESEVGADPADEEQESGSEQEENSENFVQDDEETGEGTQEPSFTLSPDTPIPVYLVEPEQEEYELEVFALSGSYPGTIADTYLDYFRGIVQKLGWDEHYVVYRSGQYAYTLVYGKGVDFNGTRFIGNGNVVNLYRSASSSNYEWYVSYSTDTLSLTAGSLFIYSDLGTFPELREGGTHIESLTLLFSVGFAVVYSVCHDIFDYIMEHVYRK